MKTEEQLKEWVRGNPIHNEEKDECVFNKFTKELTENQEQLLASC